MSLHIQKGARFHATLTCAIVETLATLCPRVQLCPCVCIRQRGKFVIRIFLSSLSCAIVPCIPPSLRHTHLYPRLVRTLHSFGGVRGNGMGGCERQTRRAQRQQPPLRVRVRRPFLPRRPPLWMDGLTELETFEATETERRELGDSAAAAAARRHIYAI